MPTVPATITIDFTANFAGCHRLFWRRGATGAYNGPVLAVPECTGEGNPCSITFTDIVDTESCDAVDYEGYVQACCEEEASLTGRVAWNLTWTPSPSCLPITFTCDNVPVESVTVTTPGDGYDYATEDGNAVTINGGGGAGATGTMQVGQGDVKSLLIANPGAINLGANPHPGSVDVYTWTSVSHTDGVNSTFILGGGGSATEITVDVTTTWTQSGGGPSGDLTVTGIAFVSDTSGAVPHWSDFDTFTLDSTLIGGVLGAIIEVQSDESEIVGVTVTAPGSGFTSAPTVVIDPPGGGGTTATAVAVLDGCSNGWVVGDQCAGGNYSVYPANTKPELGQSFDVCVVGGVLNGTPGTEYVTAANPSGCCATCHSMTIQNDNDFSVWVAYIDCNTGDFAELEVLANTTGTVNCIITGSDAVSDTANVTVTYGSSCIVP